MIQPCIQLYWGPWFNSSHIINTSLCLSAHTYYNWCHYSICLPLAQHRPSDFLFSPHIKGRAAPLTANCALFNVISRDLLLGAATSCETPPARTSPTLPLQRKTQWSPEQFVFHFLISFASSPFPPLWREKERKKKKPQQQSHPKTLLLSAIYLTRNRAAQRCGSRFGL